MTTACTLVRLGHTDVWNYPYAVFVVAIEEAVATHP